MWFHQLLGAGALKGYTTCTKGGQCRPNADLAQLPNGLVHVLFPRLGTLSPSTEPSSADLISSMPKMDRKRSFRLESCLLYPRDDEFYHEFQIIEIDHDKYRPRVRVGYNGLDVLTENFCLGSNEYTTPRRQSVTALSDCIRKPWKDGPTHVMVPTSLYHKWTKAPC